MALKKHPFLSLFIFFTLLLIGFLFVVRPSNLDIYIEKKDRLYEANAPIEVTFKHFEETHPYLDPEAIISVRIEDASKSISLNIIDVDTFLFNQESHLTTLTFESPFSEVKTPFILEESTLLIITNKNSLSFNWGRFAIYDNVPKNSDLIKTLYGFYKEDIPSLEGVYLGLNVPQGYMLETARVESYEIALDEIIYTDESYVHGSKISEYVKSQEDLPLETFQIILPFESENTLEAVPIYLEFKRRYETIELYLPPFTTVLT